MIHHWCFDCDCEVDFFCCNEDTMQIESVEIPIARVSYICPSCGQMREDTHMLGKSFK